jgi:phosphatidylglycerophosphate synthase
MANLGAFLFLLAGVIDHADGELARMSGKTSEWGHAYDRAVDLVAKTSLFVGMGIGLESDVLGAWAVPMGFVAGLSLVAIFALRGAMAKRRGRDVYKQPSFAGFELEDILYLIAPVTWFGGLASFFSLAVVGIPAFAAWTALRWWRMARAPAAEASGQSRR